jgi:iron complex outermembrane receptor protein/hemoglobin/transferrin/lactoferrin receptor protein
VLLPDYLTHTFAVMVFEEARLGSGGGEDPRVIVNGGLRLDGQHLQVFPDARRGLPDGVGRSYRALSGSAGLVVRLGDACRLAGTVGRGWRPPNPFELFANGVHGGVSAVQIGNPALGKEAAASADVSLRWDAPALRASVTAYRNRIDHFIYLADTGTFADVSEGHLPVFTFRQTGAVLRGVEVETESAPARWLRLTAGASHVVTENRETGGRLPQTPADRADVSLQVRGDRLGRLLDPGAALEAVLVGRGRVSGADEPFGTPTSPYALLNGHAGAGWPVGVALLRVDVAIRNLLDRRYTDFLWTYKPWAPSPGRDVRVLARVTF